MGATFLVRQVDPVLGQVLHVNSRSEFQSTFERVFGAFPYTLEQEDCAKLVVLSALVPTGKG